MAFIYDLTDTWNAGGTTFNAIKMNVTDTASAAASKLITVQVSGSEKFSVKKDGVGYFAGNVGIGTSSPARQLDVDGLARFNSSGNYMEFGTNELTSEDAGGAHIRAAVTSAAYPTYSLSGDKNTGLFFPAADTLAVTTAGTERLRITSAGDVAIGGTTANARLEVLAPATTSSDIAFFSNSAGAQKAVFRLDANGDGELMLRDAGNNEDVVITSGGDSYFNGGNVGIGTTSPTSMLHLKGASEPTITLEDTSIPSKVELRALNYGFGVEINDSEALRIDTDGNVGIGTSSPLKKLHVHGDALIQPDAVADINLVLRKMAAQTGNILEWQESSGTKLGVITSAGNVGIGTSSPTNLLDLNGGVTVQQAADIKWQNTARTSTYGGISSLASALQFKWNGSERMRITSGGNVGIGTSSPDQLLHLSANSSATLRFESTKTSVAADDVMGAIEWEGNDATTGSSGVVGKIDYIAEDNTPEYAMRFFTHDNVGGVADFAERLRITSSGNVAIGTSSPSYKLQIEDTTTNVYTQITSSTTGIAGLLLGDQNNRTVGRVSYDNSDNSLALYSNNFERMRITSAGSVGIGTTSPSRILDLSSNVPAVRLTDTTTSGLYHEVLGDGNSLSIRADQGSVGASSSINFLVDSSERMRIDSSGNLLVGTTSVPTGAANGKSFSSAEFRSSRNTTSPVQHVRFYNTNGQVGNINTSGSATAYVTSSDARLKKNIADADDASNLIDAIQVRKFDWKADGSHQRYGMVAQELLEVAPEAVSGEPEGEDMMGVDYSKLVPMLIKEIQSMRLRLAQLEG